MNFCKVCGMMQTEDVDDLIWMREHCDRTGHQDFKLVDEELE